MARQRLQGLLIVLRRRVGPGRNRALVKAKRWIGDDQRWVKVELMPQPIAVRASAKGVVKGKEARFNLLNRKAALRAGKLGRKDFPLSRFIGGLDDGQTLR